MESLVLQTRDTAGTLALGGEVAAALLASGEDRLCLQLEGDLGAGKTVLVRGLARGLGVPSSVPVVSPTFTIARDYALPPGTALAALHHVDAYRLGGADELDAAGFEEMCGDGRVTCVEWGGRVAEALPEDRVRIELEPAAEPAGEHPGLGEATRRVTLTARGARARRVLALLAARRAAGSRP